MKESPRDVLRRVGKVELACFPVMLVLYMALAIAGVIHWWGVPFSSAPLILGAALYGASRISVRRKPKTRQLQVEPFTRTPDYNQCPVCGIADLGDYRFKDQFLALIGEEKYVQKWGKHDAHWSCVTTCPYEQTPEEHVAEEHQAGKHRGSEAMHIECEKCVRQIEMVYAEREDQASALPGCCCKKCYSMHASIYRSTLGMSYEPRYAIHTMNDHYELMLAESPPGSARRAYALMKLEKWEKLNGR